MSQLHAGDDFVAVPVTNSEKLPGAGPPRAASRGAVLRNAISTVIVVALLLGLAAWGHSTGWTLPKYSEITGQGEVVEEAWCQEHNVPEAQCIECNHDLVPHGTIHAWCQVHGIPHCPLEHPDVSQPMRPYSVTPADLARAERALSLRPRVENNPVCTSHERRVQFASIETMEKVGVDIAPVGRRRMVEALTANGEVVYDETRTGHLASRVPGVVWRVEKQVGDTVGKGDVLALIDSSHVGQAKGELLQAIAQLRLAETTAARLRPLAGGAISNRDVREAEAAQQLAQIRVMSAQQALVNLGLPVNLDYFGPLTTEEIAERIRFLGLPADMVTQLAGETTTSNLFPLRSPIDGVVVARAVVAGEVVDSQANLFQAADVRRMWLTLNVRQEDVAYLALGQRVLFRPSDSKQGEEIEGSLAWISTAADDQTRTVKVRVDLPNTDGRLRANTFGTGRIVLREEPEAIVVPSEAVQYEGCCNVVFVRDKNFLTNSYKFFHVRKVRLGVKEDGMTEIIAGLLPGEVIASKNSMILAAQLLKSNLGAGCGCATGHK
jgi:membrane fusion protein, heavy metal efflux system